MPSSATRGSRAPQQIFTNPASDSSIRGSIWRKVSVSITDLLPCLTISRKILKNYIRFILNIRLNISSFSFRLTDDDSRAAPTGVVETTKEPTSHNFPTNPKVKLWDLPEIGTKRYPDLETYCEKVQLETKYNVFLIFTASRFTDYGNKLATKIKSFRKKFFFIRAKIDVDDASEKLRLKGSFDESVFKETIRSYSSGNLKGQMHDEQDIFLISNRDVTKWDFARFQHAIIGALPTSQQQSLLFSFGTKTREVLQSKVKGLKQRIWMIASLSAAAGTIPVSGFSIAVQCSQ